MGRSNVNMYINTERTRTSNINNNRMARMRTECHIPNRIKSSGTILGLRMIATLILNVRLILI